MKFNPKIVFLGTPQFAAVSLQGLYDAGLNVVCVICQPDKPAGRGQKLSECAVKKLAIELKLDVEQPLKLNKDDSLKDKLKALSPDLMVTAAYGQLISEEIISIPKWGIWNVHASLLPQWRGAAPINWSILNGDRETGITIMQTEKGLDTGPVLNIESLPIQESDNAITLTEQLASLGSRLLIETINKKINGEIIPQIQDHGKATYASKLAKEMGLIDFKEMTSEQITRKIRALTPWPGCYFEFVGDEKIKLLKASSLNETGLEFKSGQIIKIEGEKFYVKCKEGVLLIEEMQPPNKNRMTAGSWLRGRSLKVGDML